MTSRTAYPPTYHHNTKLVAPAEAQKQLAAFLAKTSSNAYLHPDAILSQNGIQFPAQSGPQGGLALHHLRRIEAGLRGEDLIVESREELKALFSHEAELPAGDDKRLDALITRSSKRSRSAERVEQWQSGDGVGDIAASGALGLDEYAHEQMEIEEEIGNDTLANTGVLRTSVPEIQTTTTPNGKTDAEKAARKAAKKEKRQKEKKAKLKAG